MESKITRRFILFFFLTALIFNAVEGRWAFGADEKYIRVAILKDVSSLTLAIKGKFDLVQVKTGRTERPRKVLNEAKVRPSVDGLMIGPEKFMVGQIKIIPQRDATIFVNNRRFRGEVNIIKNDQELFTVVNHVELEDYIKGVLYHEVSHRWSLETFKVQAIATRTYAFYRMKQGRTQDYDLTDDIYSQVYGGRSSERYRTNIAVNKTKGLILTYKGQILPAYFHATCGGATEDVSELWKEDLPPLKGVICTFCQDSPHYNWKKNFRLSDIQDKLNSKGYQLRLIKEISVVERNKSGRIRLLEIITRDGQKITVSGKDFRNIVGPNLLKSNNYEIIMKGYFMDLFGHGWGHGVGMCQWGVNAMARLRYKYDEILKYYYPGVEIGSYEAYGF